MPVTSIESPRQRPSTRGRQAYHWLLAVTLGAWVSLTFAACGITGPTNHTLTIAAMFPATGPASAIGQSMSRAVDLAVKQNASLGGGYTLTDSHVDEAQVPLSPAVAQAIVNPQVVGVVGPLDSQAAVDALPATAQAGVVMVSPTATLPGLTKTAQASSEGLTFTQLHPTGKPNTFFRLTADDTALASAAADLALASPNSHGLGARNAFIVDDGSPTGKAQSTAFQAEFTANHGTIASSRTITPSDEISVQSAVSAIVDANPSIVFVAGDLTAAANLRAALTLTGAPQMGILVAGAAADDPTWGTAVGGPALAGGATGLLPAQDLTKATGAQSFVQAYQSAYPNDPLTPQSALAYDAAMVEINAIKSVISAHQTPTPAAVLAQVASASYSGVTGHIAFDQQGDPQSPPAFSVYTCDAKGAWTLQTTIPSAPAK